MKKICITIIATLVALGLIMGGAVGVKHFLDNRNAEEEPAVADPGDAYALQQWLLSFTVDERAEILDFVMEAAKNPRSTNSHPVTAAARKEATGYSDATSFPFVPYNKTATEYTDTQQDAMYTELLTEYVTNPFLGMQLVLHNYDVEIAPGITLGSLNKSWADPGIQKYETEGLAGFDTYRSVYWTKYGVELPANSADMPAWRAEHPSLPEPTAEDATLVTDGNGKKIIYVNDDWIRLINNNLILLMSAERTGIQTWNTSKHYLNLPVAEWRDARPIMNTDTTYRDKLPLLGFAYIRKDGSKVGEFGHNLSDKRLEENEAAPTQPTKPSDPPTKPSDPPTKPSDPPTKPSDPPTKPSDPPTKPSDPPKDGEGIKDPISDPVNQGNADRGGGQNDPDNNEDPFYPEDPANDKTQGHQDPSDSYPTTPPQDDDHKDTYVPPENVDENKMPDKPDAPPTSSWTTDNGSTTTFNGSVTPSEGNDGPGPDSGGENATQTGGNGNQGSTTPDPGDFLEGGWGGPPD